jgi:excisionase family DNA binding protein
MELLTIPDAARVLGVSAREVRGWIEDGRLPAEEVEGRRLIRVEEVERLERRPPEFPGPVEVARIDELEALRGELAELARRVEALEADRREADGERGRMRSALTPLFRPEPGSG